MPDQYTNKQLRSRVEQIKKQHAQDLAALRLLPLVTTAMPPAPPIVRARLTQYIPAFVDYDPVIANVSTWEDILSLSWIQKWGHDRRDFSLSDDNHYLMAEIDDRQKRVIGIFSDGVPIGLLQRTIEDTDHS